MLIPVCLLRFARQRTAIRGMRLRFCARATTGHAAAPPHLRSNARALLQHDGGLESLSGQTEKNSVRAIVFRFAPESGPYSMRSALLICAMNRQMARASCAKEKAARRRLLNLSLMIVTWHTPENYRRPRKSLNSRSHFKIIRS
jgi:hypothetical protein